MNEQRTLWVRAFLTVGVVSSIFSAGGCVSYTNVGGPKSAPAFQTTNHFMAGDVAGDALDYVLARHGPKDGLGYVVNLPAGTTQENAMEIFAQLPAGAVWPNSTDQDPSGMYHVGRVWIRMSEAKVDVVYPFEMLNGGMGQRGVTVWLQGGVRNWRVIRGQYWAPGTVEVPPVSVPWPEDIAYAEHEAYDGSGGAPVANEYEESVYENPVEFVEEPADWIEPEGVYEQTYEEPSYEPVEYEPVRTVPIRPEPVPGTDGSALWREIPVEDF